MSAANQEDEKGQNPISISAAQASAEVIAVITQHKNGGKNRDKAALETAIEKCLRNYFTKLPNDKAKKDLYKKLSLTLHSDKLRSNVEIYAHLESINSKEMPFDCLTKCLPDSNLKETIESPFNWLKQVGIHIFNIFILKMQREPIETTEAECRATREASLPDLQSELAGLERQQRSRTLDDEGTLRLNQLRVHINKTATEITQEIKEQASKLQSDLTVELASEKAELGKIAPGLPFVLGLGEDADRYVQPFRFFINLIMWPLNIAMGITIFVLSIATLSALYLVVLAFWLPTKILDFVLTLVTFGHYSRQMNIYKDSKANEAFAQTISTIKDLDPDLRDQDDDTIFTQNILPGLALAGIISKEQYMETLRKGASPTLFVFLKCSFKALWHSLTKCPDGFLSLLWLLTWPVRLALTLPLIAVGLVVKLAEAAVGLVGFILLLAPIFVAAVVRTLTLLALNLPLYLLVDFPRAVAKCCCGGDRKSERSPEPGREFKPTRSSTISATQKDKDSDDEDEVFGSSYQSKQKSSNSATSTDQSSSSNAKRVSLTPTFADEAVD